MKHLKYFESSIDDDYSTWGVGDDVYLFDDTSLNKAFFILGNKYKIDWVDKRDLDSILISVNGYTLRPDRFTKNPFHPIIAIKKGSKFGL